MATTAVQTVKLHTLDQIKRAAAAAGSHWFDPSALRFFSSRLGRRVYPVPGGALFISSEQFRGYGSPDGPRLYSVRSCTLAGEIDTVGEFQAHSSRESAHNCAAHLQREGFTLA
jgi:hypothetical protein